MYGAEKAKDGTIHAISYLCSHWNCADDEYQL
jgi:nitrite reductase/ring-hydroxylating ferredoxin subunit